MTKREILEEWYPTWGKGGWGDHSNCMCDQCKDYRIDQALSALSNLEKKERLTEDEIEHCINLFIKKISTDNRYFDLSAQEDLAHSLFTAQEKKGKE